MKINMRTEVTALEELSVFASSFNQIVKEIADETTQQIRPGALDELGYTPGKSKSPVRWTPAAIQDKPPNTQFGYYSKQKAAYFATNGFGKGIPYQRTGRSAKSWFVRSSTKDNVYFLNIGTSWKDAKYVYGDLLVKDANRAMRPMQGFHRDTGWLPARETVLFWMDASRDVFIKRFNERLSSDLGSVKFKRRIRR